MKPEPKYAVWRVYADRQIPIYWIGFGTGLAAIAMGCLAIGRIEYFIFMGGTALGHFVNGQLVSRKMSALRDDPEGGQFAVSLRLSRGQTVNYGFDEGLLSFEDGWLVFQGRRCVFSVSAKDVALRSLSKNAFDVTFGPDDQVRQAHFTVFGKPKLIETVTAWTGGPIPEGQGVLPPQTASDSAIKALFPLAAIVGLLIVAAIWLLMPTHQGSLLAVVCVSIAALYSLGYLVESARVLRAMRRGDLTAGPFWMRRRSVPPEDAEALPNPYPGVVEEVAMEEVRQKL